MLTRLISLSCLILQFFLPWWIIGPVAFLFAAWMAKSPSHAFKTGFNAIFIMWLIIALIKTLPNDNILANRVGQMLMLPDWSLNWIIVILLTAVAGGLVAGIAAFAGYFWRFIFPKNR